MLHAWQQNYTALAALGEGRCWYPSQREALIDLENKEFLHFRGVIVRDGEEKSILGYSDNWNDCFTTVLCREASREDVERLPAAFCPQDVPGIREHHFQSLSGSAWHLKECWP